MKLLVLGAGATGGYFAGRLAQAAHDVADGCLFIEGGNDHVHDQA